MEDEEEMLDFLTAPENMILKSESHFEFISIKL